MKLKVERKPVYIGLDAEALSGPEWADNTNYSTRLAICFGFGVADNIQYIEAVDMTAGIFNLFDLDYLYDVVAQKNAVIVAHNAKYDLELLNGVLLDHKQPMLPSLRYIDTMNTLKSGRAFRNTLRDRCLHYGVNLKSGGPDWRAVLQRKPEAWEMMREYNENDVLCTLELAKAYVKAGLPCPIRTWQPRKR